MTTPAQVAARFGLANSKAIVEAAERAGLPLAAACALIEKESLGRNIYGHDTGGAGPHGQRVTRTNYRRFIKRVLAGATSNGVGPAQITWAGSLRSDGTRDGGFFTAMQERGLKPWAPVDNMRFGFELLAGYHAASGSWVTAGERYNGARAYGEDLAKKVRAWQVRLKAAAPSSDLRVVALNLHAGAGSQGHEKAGVALDLMESQGAPVGIFTEAKTAIRPFRRSGLRVLGENPKSRNQRVLPEEGDTVAVVDGLEVRRWRTAVQRLRFIVRSKNRWHDPRRDQVVMLKGPVRGVWAMHGPPGGPGSVNGKAWREQMDDALKWADRGGCRAIIGDINANAETVRQYAKKHGYDVVVEGRGPDLVIVFGGSVKHHNLGDQGPSFDHMAGRYDITADPK